MRISKSGNKITISIVGAGNRAAEYMKAMKKFYPDNYELVAIFEPKKIRQEQFHNEFGVPKDKIFNGYEDFIKMDRLSDVVIISTLDDMHFIPAMAAIEKGYDIILEKPISWTLSETIKIGDAGRKRPNQLIAVCHVLRHSPLFVKLKEIVDSKVLGEIVNIQHNENVGYFHFAHSYVRGSWRNTTVSAPFVVAKSCHDMDIILYLLKDKHCKRLSSMGELTFFKRSNYDKEKMAPRCSECKIEESCPYSALKIYSGGKMKSVVFDSSSVEKLKAELANSVYGRCVFHCDNNVCDHQVTILEFEGGVHASFNLSGFTDKIHRSLKIMCQYGEIRAIETTKEIEITHFGGKKELIQLPQSQGGHGGADEGFVKNFMESYLHNKPFDSTLEMSIESHIMAYAAENSRINKGNPIDINEYHEMRRNQE